MNSQKFLEELYETKTDDSYILLWQRKKSKWFKNLLQASKHIDKNPNDMYFGVGLSPKNYGSTKRCKAANIAGIPGFYVDIDVGEKSKTYPPTMKDAVSIVDDPKLKPTMIVSSGYGIHAYWLFKEVWMFDREDERNFAAELSKRLNYFTKEKAEKQGWTIDNVSDLSRILRPAGSFNCKSLPIKVSVISNNGPRYSDPDIFDQTLPIPDVYGIKTTEYMSAKELIKLQRLIKLQKVAEPPQDRLDQLIEIDNDFKAAWTKVTRKGKDNSASGYHMIMTIIALRAGWSDQEIANLLIAWNRRHGLDLEKITKRADYMVRTIENARGKVSEKIAEEYTKDLKDTSGSKYEETLAESRKKKGLEVISHHLGFKIFKMIKYVQEKKPRYKMESTEGDIMFTGPDEIHMKSKFEQRILAETNRAISLSVKNFQILKETYKPIMEEVIVSQESTLEGRMKMWLIEYLDGAAELNQHQAAVDNEPFVYNGHWHVFASRFKSWAYRKKHDRDDMDKIKFDLNVTKSVQKRFNPQHPDHPTKRTPRYPWKVPRDIIIPKGHDPK